MQMKYGNRLELKHRCRCLNKKVTPLEKDIANFWLPANGGDQNKIAESPLAVTAVVEKSVLCGTSRRDPVRRCFLLCR